LASDARRALADVRYAPFWLEDTGRPEPEPALAGATRCDLAVVGGGYSGLWTALLAKQDDPTLDVVLLEAREVGWAASGRNGGFCDASLTHGLMNGLQRFPAEYARLDELGLRNFREIEATIRRHDIDCDFERSGTLTVAVAPWQLDELCAHAQHARRHGHEVTLLDRAAVRAEVASPTYLGGMWERGHSALVQPARLAWGLKAACLASGVRIFEGTLVVALERARRGVNLRTAHGRVHTRRAALGTNAFPPLVRRVRRYVAPIYDYALVTEPLSAPQLAALGWRNRQGITDGGNQFHYYRRTRDERILWGGYDAIYHFGNGLRAELDRCPRSFVRLAAHFLATFPQLEGIRFTHAWGGAIDTCSRFCAFWGTAHGGRVSYAAGYTGLGIAATRFGAQVMLDLLWGRRTERTELQLVGTLPVPFPPEPLRYAGIQITRRSLAAADRNGGRRNAWLRALDRLGMGYDS
jgi:glycine/D-amino acid oxidase-like deaminating enzyme